MRIRCVTPPKALQKGGIENAVEGLREALLSAGADVLDDVDPTDELAVHHFHGLWNPAHARIAGVLRKAKRPYVVSPHGMLEPWALRHKRWKKIPYLWLVERPMLSGAAALFVTSGMERAHLGRVIDHPDVRVLPLGCRDPRGPQYQESRDRLGWKSGERVMLFLSRVDPKKGLDMLLKALGEAPERFESWRLAIVGDGPEEHRRELETLQATLEGKLPRVDWVGPVWGEDRWDYLRGADLFCLPTHSENFGIAVLEALHAGTPVLTTTGTPWVEYREKEGVFISDPTVASIHSALIAATDRIEAGWGDRDRCRLAAWAEDRFAWSRLAPAYLDAYFEAAGEMRFRRYETER